MRLTLGGWRRCDGDKAAEEGATLVIAVIVMMILSTLSIAILARTLSVLGSMRSGQDFDAALAAADAGLSDALFKIDQSAPPDWTATGVAGAGQFAYTADKVSETEYVVRSRGTVGRSNHAVAARVTRTARFPYALFSQQNLTLDGRVGGRSNFYSFDVVTGTSTEAVNVGSNGTTVCQGGSFPTGLRTRAVAGNKDCPNFAPLSDPEPMTEVVAPTGATQPCPVDGVFTGTVDGGGGTPYVCRRDVSFVGTVTVTNPPLIVYVLPDVDASGNLVIGADGKPIYHSLDMRGAVVNSGGYSKNVQIYKAGDAPIHLDPGNTSDTLTFSGVLYAPQSSITINGGKWWTGSVMTNEVRVNGTPNLKIGYDLGLRNYYGKDWKVSRYSEIPSGSPGLP
ncbi:MAG: hypothetical protein KY439_07195 [Actinobacteria bacterium]|nr:hypothetical protein [Actinomycetota bacterium]